PEFLGDVRADAPQVACNPFDFGVDVAAQALATVADAIQQADADGDGADVELLGPHHVDGFEYFLAGEVEMAHLRSSTTALDSVHRLENLLALNLDPHRQLGTLARQPFAQLVKGYGGAGEVDHHDHGEEFADHR